MRLQCEPHLLSILNLGFLDTMLIPYTRTPEPLKRDGTSSWTKTRAPLLFHCWLAPSVWAKGRHWYKARFQATRTLRSVPKLGPLIYTSDSLEKKETYQQKLNEQICSWFSCGHIAVVPKLPCVPVTWRALENRRLGQPPEVSESLDLSWSLGSYLSLHFSPDAWCCWSGGHALRTAA